jgi:hypothetical protein
MTPEVLLQVLGNASVVVIPRPDGTVRCKAPKGTLTPEMLTAIRTHKAALCKLIIPCFEHDPVFFDRQGAGWVCWKCVLLSSGTGRETPEGTKRPSASKESVRG